MRIQNVLDVISQWTALLISSKMSFENELFCWMMDDTALDNESLVPLGSSIHPKVSVFCPDLTHLPDNERRSAVPSSEETALSFLVLADGRSNEDHLLVVAGLQCLGRSC